jgi:hypothetical protein
MHYDGIIIGATAFAIIGVFHPIVIRGEYHFGVSVWPFFAVTGTIALLFSFLLENYIARAILGITGFTLYWSILELFHQAKRVKKGWYPKNPRRNQ